MPDHDAPSPRSTALLQALLTAARAFSIVLGVSGFGLLGGLGYGAWTASRGVQDDLVWLGWVICLILYGSVGFVVGLGVGMVGMVAVGVVRLVRRAGGGLVVRNG